MRNTERRNGAGRHPGTRQAKLPLERIYRQLFNPQLFLMAMDRLLAGTPLRSTGRLSVSQLAVEAGVKRWHLTHQHLDLKDLFQARVKARGSTPEAFAKELSEHEALKKKYANLRQHCADLEERLRVYATAINLLVLENATRTRRQRFRCHGRSRAA